MLWSMGPPCRPMVGVATMISPRTDSSIGEPSSPTAAILLTSPCPGFIGCPLCSNDGFSVRTKAPSSQIICKVTLTSSRFVSIGVVPVFADCCSGGSSNKPCKRVPLATAHSWQTRRPNLSRPARCHRIALARRRLPSPRQFAHGETTTGRGYRTQMDTPFTEIGVTIGDKLSLK